MLDKRLASSLRLLESKLTTAYRINYLHFYSLKLSTLGKEKSRKKETK